MVFYSLCITMIIQGQSSQRGAFRRGVLDAFVAPFVLPVTPQPKKWSPKKSSVQDDADNLSNDWRMLGFYVSNAVNEYERNPSKTR